MPYLLPLVLSIILTSIMLVTTMDISSFGARHALELTSSIIAEHEEFQGALEEYKKENLSYTWVEDCPPNASSGDPECVFDRQVDPLNDGRVDVGSWQTQLIPDFMFTPYTKGVLSWSLNEDGNGLYVCSELKYDDITARTAIRLIKHYGTDAFKVGAGCAVATSLNKAGVLSYAGTNIYFTKWINY